LRVACLCTGFLGRPEQIRGQPPSDKDEGPGAKALFENIHVAKWPILPHGYRTAMGDMFQHKDGRLMLSYVRDVYEPIGEDHGPELVARYSSDVGASWGEEFILIP
jgi:hypothetical protein